MQGNVTNQSRRKLLVCAGLFAVSFVSATALISPDGVHAADLECGTTSTEQPAAVRAEVTTSATSNVVTLGRSTTGTREWEIEFFWTAECSLDDDGLTVRISTLQGADASVNGAVINTTWSVDSTARRILVTLSVPRSTAVIPPGEFSGTVEIIGDGLVGVAKAAIMIRHQEPMTQHSMTGFEQILWIVGGGLATGVLTLAAQRERGKKSRWADVLLAPLLLTAAVTLYPVVARLRGSTIPSLWWPIWLGAFGLVGGFLIAVLKHQSGGASLTGGIRFGAAMILSFGGGVAVWRSQYLNTPGWALTMESAIGLISVVGGATVTSALLLLAPTPGTPAGEE